MKRLLIALSLFSPLMVFAQSPLTDSAQVLQTPDTVKEWGIAIGFRSASIPYADIDERVHDFVPKMYYQGKYLFLEGEAGGLRFYQQPNYSTSVIGRYRYFDIPAEKQNEFQGSEIDLGLQFEYKLQHNMPLQFELLSDTKGNFYANTFLRYEIDAGDWELDLNTRLRLKSSDFNNLYYGLGSDDIGSDFDVRMGAEVRYHVFSHLYLLGEVNLTRLGSQTSRSDNISSPTQGDLFLGFGLFNDKKNPKPLTLPDNHYLRYSFGWATPSNIGEIIRFNSEKDEYNNRMTSIFYGYPLTETLFDVPIELFLTGGLGYHLESKVQDPILESVLAIKAYYTFSWPLRWRLGFAEGLSYVNEVTYIEATEMEEKGYEESHLLNYLDFSLDINLGDLVQRENWRKIWLGYAIHHRSAIFEKSSMFGRIKGGSNYNTLYLQWHF